MQGIKIALLQIVTCFCYVDLVILACITKDVRVCLTYSQMISNTKLQALCFYLRRRQYTAKDRTICRVCL